MDSVVINSDKASDLCDNQVDGRKERNPPGTFNRLAKEPSLYPADLRF